MQAMKEFCVHKSNVLGINKKILDLVQDGKRYRLTIKEWRDKRSLSQNALSHMWYEDIAKQGNERVGRSEFTMEAVKKDLKKAFLGYEEVERTNITTSEKNRFLTLKKTSELDKGDMHSYLEKIEAWAFNNGFNLKIPADCEYMKLKQEQE